MRKDPVCPICDCDDWDACFDPIAGTPCFWVNVPTLNGGIRMCSVCARITVAMVTCGELELGDETELFLRTIDNQFEAWKRFYSAYQDEVAS